MRLGIIGNGPWANTHAATLSRMGVDYLKGTRNWRTWPYSDGVIVASAAASHFGIADQLMQNYIPCLIEKPVCLLAADARYLLHEGQSNIVFTGHTRLYSNAWRAFKAQALAAGVHSLYMSAGGPCKIAHLFDWGSHLVAMCLDLGYDPLQAHILTSDIEQPLKVIVNGSMTYTDQPETPAPLEVLLREFMAAIEKGEPDIRGLELGVRVVEALEAIERCERLPNGT